MVSPEFRPWELMRWPLMRVPLVEPRSAMTQPSSVRESSACLRLTLLSESTRSAEASSRPMIVEGVLMRQVRPDLVSVSWQVVEPPACAGRRVWPEPEACAAGRLAPTGTMGAMPGTPVRFAWLGAWPRTMPGISRCCGALAGAGATSGMLGTLAAPLGAAGWAARPAGRTVPPAALTCCST